MSNEARGKIKQIFYELKQHAPFTALATAAAVLIVIFVLYFLEKSVSKDTFELFHFLHIMVSAMVTAGIFYKYLPPTNLHKESGITTIQRRSRIRLLEKILPRALPRLVGGGPKIFSAVLVGMLGAIIIGSLSDVVFPYLGWFALNLDIHFHLPLIEETGLVLFSTLLGSLAGAVIKMTKCPHFIHIFLSVFASLFYLLAFSLVFSPGYFIAAFFVVFIAVIIPCCLSDIIFPFFFLPTPLEMSRNQSIKQNNQAKSCDSNHF